VKENESWRIRRNDELEAIIKGMNIVRFIKSQRIRWLGHTERMQDTAIPKKMLYGRLYATRRSGRPKGTGKVPLWGRSALQPYRLIVL
jgi:hypothetical protein